jgi:hypothetical protein
VRFDSLVSLAAALAFAVPPNDALLHPPKKALDKHASIYEHEFVFMNRRLCLFGLAIWIVATVLLRLRGLHLLQPSRPTATLFLFAASFLLMALVARSLCRRLQLPRGQWPAGAISLALPMLLLDPFSSAFFPLVFPNMPPEVAGIFGGWMLICCAGALVGVLIPSRNAT